MNLPFNKEQFLDVFKQYNYGVWPMQIVLLSLAALAIYYAILMRKNSGLIISVILSSFWLWMGVAYHLFYFTSINKAAYLFGAFFVLQAVLFLRYGVVKKELDFKPGKSIRGMAGTVMIIYALLIYPLLGYYFGHEYPSAPTFGLPCPTTIFTFGLFLWIDKKVPFALFVIPFLWSLLGSSATFLLGIKEDTGLLISGLVTLILLIQPGSKRETKNNA